MPKVRQYRSATEVIRGCMKAARASPDNLARAMFISRATLNRRLQHPEDLTIKELRFMQQTLRMTDEDIEYVRKHA